MEWDSNKEQLNIKSHHLDFEQAMYVFNDHKRIIYIDEKHSVNEERLFCIGKVGNEILTVRFLEEERRFELLVQVDGEKGLNYMKKKTQKKDDDMPVGKLTRIELDIPPPHKLNFGEKTKKVTIALEPSTIEFFKKASKKTGNPYQKIIRQILASTQRNTSLTKQHSL